MTLEDIARETAPTHARPIHHGIRRLATPAVFLVLCACGPTETAPSDASGMAPTIRDVRVDVQAEPPVTLDLGSGPATRILLEPTSSEWIVSARDDVTPGEELTVVLLGADDAPLADQSATFDRGNWRVAAVLEPDSEVRVSVTDGDGDAAIFEHAFSAPPIGEALASRWEQRQYDADQMVVSRTELRLDADGAWSSTASGAAGTWSITGGVLTLEERTREGGDADEGTVERTEETPFFVDELYLSLRPWTRTADTGTGPVGTFERTWTEIVAGRTTTVFEELTLGDDGAYAWSRVTEEDGTVTSTETAAGTFETQTAENYEESLGDFLIFVESARDGEALPSPESRIELFITPGPLLLVSPHVRAGA